MIKLIMLLTLLSGCVQEKEEFVKEKKQKAIRNYVGLKNQNSYYKDGVVKLTTTPDIDANYHRMTEFVIRLPETIKVQSSDGVITADLVISNYADECTYIYDGEEFVKDRCDNNLWNEMVVSSCLKLVIEGTRNSSVFLELEVIQE